MQFGTTYDTIERIVDVLQSRLRIAMQEADNEEIGRYFWWAPLDEEGNSSEFLDVKPSHYVDADTGEHYLGNKAWEGFTFIIDLSPGLWDKAAKIRDLIGQGALVATEL